MLKKITRVFQHKKTKQIYTLTLTIFFLVTVVSQLLNAIDTSKKVTTPEVSAKVYKTSSPKKISDDKSILIGKVISNESARVFSRRAGIVDDIFVDIGDSVVKGQVLATLLPEGVEGESALEIQVKRDMMLRAADEYENTRVVSQAKIELLKSKLAEEEINLERIKSDNYSQDTMDEGNPQLRLQQEQIQLEYDQLEALKVELLELEQLQLINIQDAKNGIEHAELIYDASFENALQVALTVIEGGGTIHGDFYGLGYSISELPASLGVFNQANRADTVDSVNEFINLLSSSSRSERSELEYQKLSQQASTMLFNLQELLRSSSDIDGVDLHKLSDTVISAQDDLARAREKFENAYDIYSVTEAKDKKEAALLKEMIAKQETKILLTQENWDKNLSEVESEILKKQALIETIKKDLAFESAQVTKMVDSSKNQYNISNSMYQQTIVKKGHAQIVAPFSGIVSKRSIEVGELANISQPIFQLAGVQTSLSQKAKNEIQFGLPEDLLGVLDIGKPVAFYLPGNELNLYDAEVTRISPQLDEELYTYTIQAKLPDELNLPDGASVQVQVITGKKDTYLIDSSALKRDEDGNYLHVQENEEINKLYIDVIEEDGEFAEISGELSEEIIVVLNYFGK